MLKYQYRLFRPLLIAGAAGLLFAAACGSAAPAPAQTSQAAAPAPKAPRTPQLESATLSQADGRAEIELLCSATPAWTARAAEGDRIVLELAGATTGPDLTNLGAAQGLVSSVVFEQLETRGGPSILVSVSTRSETAYSVAGEGNTLRLSLWSREAAPMAPTPVPAAAARTPRPTSSDPSEYAIGPGDVVSIDVFGVDEFDRKTRVQGDGRIALPLLGRIQIAGLTVEQAEKEIARLLRERQLVSQPQVVVVVEEYASYGVTVQGAVQRPGIYPVLGRQSLLELIWAAGGLSGSAGSDPQIIVLRKDPGTAPPRIEVDARRLLDEGDMSLNVSLQPGDRVVVPAAQRYRVYMSGAIAKPGPVEFDSSSGLTVLQAITLAGGPTERANLAKVTIIRQLDDGKQEVIKVNVKKVQKGKAQDFFLQDNDTVRVGVWFF